MASLLQAVLCLLLLAASTNASELELGEGCVATAFLASPAYTNLCTRIVVYVK